MRRAILDRAILPALLFAAIASFPGPIAGAHDTWAAVAPRLEIYFAADFKDATYQKKVYEKVASSWKRPADTPKPGGKAVVIAVIQRNGEIAGPTIHLKSGSDAWDGAALAAVKKAAPFVPLPKSYSRESVEVHFHFAYD